MNETLFQELQYSTQDRDSSLFPNSHDCCIVEKGPTRGFKGPMFCNVHIFMNGLRVKRVEIL
jgi:hypothetical protein